MFILINKLIAWIERQFWKFYGPYPGFTWIFLTVMATFLVIYFGFVKTGLFKEWGWL